MKTGEYTYTVRLAAGELWVTDRPSAIRCLAMNDGWSFKRANKVVQHAESKLSTLSSEHIFTVSGNPRGLTIARVEQDP